MSENYNLSNREIATILCALRGHQKKIGATYRFDETTPLNANEIDTLCEKLNIGKSTMVITVSNGIDPNVFELIAGYVRMLQKAEPDTIEVTIKRGV